MIKSKEQSEATSATPTDDPVADLKYYKALLNNRMTVCGAEFIPSVDNKNFQMKVYKQVNETNYSGSVLYSELYIPVDGTPKKVGIAPMTEQGYEISSLSPYTGLSCLRVKKDGEKLFFETWRQGRFIDSQLVSDRIEFVYNDDCFGGFSWSADEKRVIFIAEKKADKETKLQDLDLSDRNKDVAKSVNLYLNGKAEQTNFGEALEKKKRPEIWTYNLDTFELSKVVNIDYERLNPSFPSFVDDKTIVFSAYERCDPQFGIRSCLNRQTGLYLLHETVLKTGSTEPSLEGVAKQVSLSDGFFSAHRPILTSDRKSVIFFGLQNPILEHMTYMGIYLSELPISGKGLEKVKNDRELVPVIETNDDVFNGFAAEHGNIQRTTIIKDKDGSDMLLFDCVHRGTFYTYLVDIAKGGVLALKQPNKGSSYMLLSSNINFGFTLAEINQKSIRRLHYVSPQLIDNYYAPIEKVRKNRQQGVQEQVVENVFFDFGVEEVPRSNGLQLILFSKVAKAKSYLVQIASGAEGTLWVPPLEEGKKAPLVLFIHGGPHAFGHYNSFFSYDQGLLLNAGYAVFIPNYTGSMGYGLKFLRGVLGKAGTVEVDDCIQLVDEVLKRHSDQIDGNRIASTGYSYGGYLTAFLAAHPEFSKRIKAAIPFNPVTEFQSMLTHSDIPEWAYAEGLDVGREINYELADSELIGMWRSSPLSLAKNVKCPVLVMVGTADLRVPPKTGMAFYRALKFMGKKNIEMNVYPGENHGLPGVEANIHSVITMMRFLKKHL